MQNLSKLLYIIYIILMFTLTQRKKHTQLIIKNTQQMLYQLTQNDKQSGFIVVIFHWLIIGMPLLYLLFGKVNTLYYLLAGLAYVVYALQIYFNGCILARIERRLLDTPQWWGPWLVLFTPLEYIGLYMTASLANQLINGGILLLTGIIFYKIYIL